MRRLALASVPILALTVLIPARPLADAREPSLMLAVPQGGHSGDMMYLSGSGLDPHRRLYLFMACPSYYNKAAQEFQNVKVEPNGPTTDAQGTFVAYPFRALTLHHFASLNCQIYTSVGQNLYGPDYPAQYLLSQPNIPLPVQYTRMPVSIKATPRVIKPSRSKSATWETVGVQSWPGAAASISVSYPDGTRERARITLLLRGRAGSGSFRFRILNQVGIARVYVRVRLGSRTNTARSTFSILH